MNGFLKSRLVLTLTAFVLVASAIALPLTGKITHSYAAPATSQASWSIVPSQNNGSSTQYLTGVAAVSTSDVWAVGTYANISLGTFQTLIEHWDGTSWSIVSSPNVGSSLILNGIAAVSTSNVWAVGLYSINGINQTLIEHWDGTSWSIVSSPNPGSQDNELNGVAVVSANDIWVMGQYTNSGFSTQPLIEHWDGTSWNVVTSPSISGILNGVAAVSATDIWAVGYSNSCSSTGCVTQTLTEHWDGTSWSIVSSPNVGISLNRLTGVSVISASDVWAVGYYTNSSLGTIQTLIEHWDGTSWSIVSSPNAGSASAGNFLKEVATTSTSDVWAVGEYGVSGTSQTLIEHWDGTSWSIVSSPNANGTLNELGGVAVVSASDVWAVGGYSNTNGISQTLIEHYAPSTTPTVTVQKVWTADGNNKVKTSFTPGDAIHYRAQVNNTNSTTVTATVTVVATGPRQIFSWSGSQSVASGTSTITKSSTVPFDAPVGTYTLTVTVTYNGLSSQGQGQFTVASLSNSAVNNLSKDNTSVQSETTVAVSSVNSPGLTVMVGYNDSYGSTQSPRNTGEGTGYSYSFDGGTSWTDVGALPVYVDSTGHAGYNGGDPGLTVDKNGTFYFTQIAYTSGFSQVFIAMSKCTYSSSTGKIGCGRPKPVSNFDSTTPNSGGYQYENDKPAFVYDPVSNRVYVTWTELTFYQGAPFQAVTKLRYYDVSMGKFSPTTYTLSTFAWANGTAPVVTSSGLVYVFYLRMNTQQQGQSIVYSTFNNGTITTNTLDNIYPAASVVSSCDSEAFTTEAFSSSTAARTNEYPAAAVDKSGNIDVVWEGATSNGGISTIFVATLPSGGGTSTIQYLPNPTHLIQWQPAVAVAGGTNTLAVTYFQVVNTSSGYQIVREQVTAPASSVPTFGAAKMISTVPWKADQTNPTFQTNSLVPNCYMGDYSASVSTLTANVVWSYWGDNRNVTSGIGPQPDIYGLFVSVP